MSEILDQVHAREWFYSFDLPDGSRTRTYHGGELDAIHDTRWTMLQQCLQDHFDGQFAQLRALDLASHQGYFSVKLAQMGFREVEGIEARRVENLDKAVAFASSAVIPVLVDPFTASVAALKPAILVDGIMAKENLGTTIKDAPLVIALGPGFEAGRDCHVAVETQRGHRLGRLIYHGSANADTGTPGVIA